MENIADQIISFNENGRKYSCHLIPLDRLPPPGTGKLIEFYHIWKKACKNRKYPSPGDLTFEDLKGWHSSLRTVEYGDDLLAPKKIKIMGEQYASYWGKEAMYDKILSDNPPRQETINKYYQYLECFVDDHYSISSGTVSKSDGSERKINWIDLPLSEDGKKITHAIGALLPEHKNFDY